MSMHYFLCSTTSSRRIWHCWWRGPYSNAEFSQSWREWAAKKIQNSTCRFQSVWSPVKWMKVALHSSAAYSPVRRFIRRVHQRRWPRRPYPPWAECSSELKRVGRCLRQTVVRQGSRERRRGVAADGCSRSTLVNLSCMSYTECLSLNTTRGYLFSSL